MGNLTDSGLGFNQYRKYKGLDGQEVSRLQKEFGANSLPEQKPPSKVFILISQFKSPLVYILLFAGLVTFLLQEFSDTYVILFAVFLNTVLGYLQEEKAGRALEALRKLLNLTAIVVRESKVINIDADGLVVGDYVIVRQGDKVPADGKLVEVNRLVLSEAILTGESISVTKRAGEDIYMGTVVVSGEGLFVVSSIGKDTQIGRIADSVQKTQEQTPLSKQLAYFSKILTLLVLVLSTLVFLVGLIFDRGVSEMFRTAVALAVSSIPEGLLVALTTILAIGMQRILKRKGLVRNLTSAETLGGVTTICTDKTGTLTLGNMHVSDFIGDESVLIVQAVVANEMSDALEVAAYEWVKKNHKEVISSALNYTRLDSIPFDSDNQFYACLSNFDSDSNVLFVNGAPEVLLSKSINMSKEEKSLILDKINQFTSKGYRVVGYAQKVIYKGGKIISPDMVNNLNFVGVLSFEDPVREDVSLALAQTKKAGIKLVLITGDFANTAQAVLSKLGINVSQENILLGVDLEQISDDGLAEWLFRNTDVKILARTKPHQKLRIVESLRKGGEVVAMLGDGVNDAPALAKSDIGIVVNESTDVAKESADLVLLDSSFATVVAAIEEGRGIFANIRKDILYLLGDAFQTIIAIILSMLFGLPLIVSASQILWMNIVSDGFPNLALTVEPKDKDLMDRDPRNPKEKIVTGWMVKIIAIISMMGGVSTFVLFYWILHSTQSSILAQSVAFASLGIIPLVYVFSVRTLDKPFWTQGLFSNKWLVLAVLLGALFQVLPYFFEFSRQFFEIVNIGIYWLVVIVQALFIAILLEISKVLIKIKS